MMFSDSENFWELGQNLGCRIVHRYLGSDDNLAQIIDDLLHSSIHCSDRVIPRVRS